MFLYLTKKTTLYFEYTLHKVKLCRNLFQVQNTIVNNDLKKNSKRLSISNTYNYQKQNKKMEIKYKKLKEIFLNSC